MSSFGDYMTITAKARADLTGRKYHLVTYRAAGEVNISSQAAVATGEFRGVLMTDNKSGHAVSVAYLGEVPVVAGAAITAGVPFTTNGSGRAIAAVSGDLHCGWVLETAAADGDLTRCLLAPSVAIAR